MCGCTYVRVCVCAARGIDDAEDYFGDEGTLCGSSPTSARYDSRPEAAGDLNKRNETEYGVQENRTGIKEREKK